MSKLKLWLSHNFALKCTALLLSLFLWAYIFFVFGVRIEKKITLQVQFTNISEQYHVQVDQKNIEVRFSAPANAIEQAEKSIRAVIDMTGYSSGSYSKEPILSFPRGIVIESISPSILEVKLEQIVSREVLVRPQLKGELMKGNVMGSIDLNPENVIVRGPESQVNQILEARVNIDISNANADIFSSIEAILINEQQEPIENLEINQRIIKVYVPVISSNVSKIVPIVPRFQGKPLYRIKSVQITPPLVTIRGNGAILEGISSAFTEAVNIEGLKESSTFNLVLTPIAEVILDIPEAGYKIHIQVEEDVEIVFDAINLKIVNLSKDLEAVFQNEGAQIRLYGPKSILSKITKLEAIIDASQWTIGEHFGKIEILQLPSEVISHVFPQKIKVKVIEKNS
jgi:YbbR domain-containing protein